jgi:hypothetical protein
VDVAASLAYFLQILGLLFDLATPLGIFLRTFTFLAVEEAHYTMVDEVDEIWNNLLRCDNDRESKLDIQDAFRGRSVYVSMRRMGRVKIGIWSSALELLKIVSRYILLLATFPLLLTDKQRTSETVKDQFRQLLRSSCLRADQGTLRHRPFGVKVWVYP